MNILRLKKASLVVLFLAVGFVRSVVAQNFNFTVQPDSLTLVPGQEASFVVSVEPYAGFTNQVTLQFTNLPSGVTASFSPQTVTPPGVSVLTLSATTNAQTGGFVLALTATGGGVTNTANASVSVSFGLLPICYGAIKGIVTDATTGKPIAGVTINGGNNYATTDTNGFYILTNLGLSGSENLPAYYNVTAISNGYYAGYSDAYAVCDATNTANVEMIREETGTLSGHITIQGGGPLTNVQVTAIFYPNYFYTNTDASGFYQFQSLPLNTGNVPTFYSVSVSPSGYWPVSSNTYVQATSNSVVDMVAIPMCFDTVSGTVIYADTGLPATNANITISTYGTIYTTTDANGNYTATNVELATDNGPTTAYIGASASGYIGGNTNVMLTNCGELGAVGTIKLAPVPPPATNHYGNISGFVYDAKTGLPITNASAYIYGVDYSTTDTNGAFSMTNINAGAGAATNFSYYIQSLATGYFSGGTNVTVDADETTNVVIYLLRIGYGGIEGTVVNELTGLPVSGVSVTAGGVNITTGSDGRYATGPIALNTGNNPSYESISVQKPGYWGAFTNTYITNGITNVVNIDMIQVCQGATIVGNVVNALTQLPITNATITTYSSGSYYSAGTDTNGNFIITNVTVGNDNSPIQTTLTASAPGFNEQDKTVTIFCDATISTTFGAPETTFGTVQGYVTNVLSGLPLTNAFIGSSFGGATTTDTNGYYILQQVPLGAGGSNRTWTVTAIPTGYPAQTKSFDAAANVTNELDFGFGQPLTELVLSATATPNPVLIGSNLLYTITLTNYAADATNVVLTDTLPNGVTFVKATVTNNPGGFGIPLESNGVITVSGSNLGSNAGVVLLITVAPTAAGSLTNIATVTSDTPDIIPGTTNHTAEVTGTAQESVTLFADVGITMTGTPNPVLVNNQLTYKLVVNNSGPDTASSVLVTDSLPGNVTFGSITVSQGTYTLGSGGIEWTVGSLANAASASASIVVLPLQTGQVDNNATVSLGPTTPPVTDNDPDNDSAEVFTTVTGGTVTNTSLVYGAIVFNPETGLYQQSLQYNNLAAAQPTKAGGPPEEEAVRVYVMGLPSTVRLYNATGTNNGSPYVEYDSVVPEGGSVTFLLEYYASTRQTFVSTNFLATAVVAVTVPPITGTYLQLDRQPFLSNGQLTIEFATVPGHTYVVQYSSDMKTWAQATPAIEAQNTRTVWVDTGPPVTTSPPGSVGDRFYRIVQTH